MKVEVQVLGTAARSEGQVPEEVYSLTTRRWLGHSSENENCVSGLGGIRTRGLCLAKAALIPTELRALDDRKYC